MKRKHLEAIADHSKESFPIECCGILIGKRKDDLKIVVKVRRAKNILDSYSRYEIDPHELLSAFEEAEDEALEVVGFYHSHPHWPPYFSEIDRTTAYYPRCSYLVWSNLKGEVRSYSQRDEEFKEEEIRIVK